jgi:transcription elongation GreA/GreB family factor
MTARGRSQDRKRVAGGQDYEVRYEAKKTGKSKSRVKRAVKKVGNSRRKVERERFSPHPNFVTAAGFAQIERARQAAREAHGAAQISGDRAKLAKASSDLRYWSARRGSARILTADQSRQTVQFGSTVTIVREARKQTFQIVGEDEAEPANGKLSYVSPLARTIMNKEVGDTATLGDSEIAIAAVSADEVASDHAADRSD